MCRIIVKGGTVIKTMQCITYENHVRASIFYMPLFVVPSDYHLCSYCSMATCCLLFTYLRPDSASGHF